MSTLAPDTALSLRVTSPDGSVQQLSIDVAGPIWFGRDPRCHVVLPSTRVSRRHGFIERVDGGALRVTDTSANGTRVAEEHVVRASRELSARVPVGVGPFELCVDQPGGESPDADRMRASGRLGDVQAGRRQRVKTADPDAPAVSVDDAAEDEGDGSLGSEVVAVATRRRIHRMLLDHLDLQNLQADRMRDEIMRPKVLSALQRIVEALGHEVPPEARARLIEELCDEALGLGPLERLLADPEVSEIMVVDPYTIFCERRGRIEHTRYRFTDDEATRAVIERIVTPLGRRIDESTPLVDARLKDGSRVNAVIKPLAVRGTCITIRKFADKRLSVQDLIGFGSMTDRMGLFLARAVKLRKNIVISGGTGSGKTTLLNVLSSSIPGDERIVTIEDAAELQLHQPHVVSLEARPANMEGKGAYTIRDLVINALRMRPDRIVVGECRGGEALDMLQAMNTGHDGSMTTTHANSPHEALSRLETLCLMAGLDLPARAIRAQIASSVQLFVQQTRFSDGSRRVTSICEVTGIDHHGEVEVREIFGFRRRSTGADGTVQGEFYATGYMPSFIDELISHGLAPDGDFL